VSKFIASSQLRLRSGTGMPTDGCAEDGRGDDDERTWTGEPRAKGLPSDRRSCDSVRLAPSSQFAEHPMGRWHGRYSEGWRRLPRAAPTKIPVRAPSAKRDAVAAIRVLSVLQGTRRVTLLTSSRLSPGGLAPRHAAPQGGGFAIEELAPFLPSRAPASDEASTRNGSMGQGSELALSFLEPTAAPL